jgi:hypothetical protein
VVLALERVAQEHDRGDGRIGGYGEVKITSRHFVDLINHQKRTILDERCFPSGDAPILVGGQVQELLPLGAEFCGWDGHAERVSEILAGE